MSTGWLAGIGGCPGGWLAIAQPEASGPSGAVRAVVAPRLESLLAESDGIRLAGIDNAHRPVRKRSASV